MEILKNQTILVYAKTKLNEIADKLDITDDMFTQEFKHTANYLGSNYTTAVLKSIPIRSLFQNSELRGIDIRGEFRKILNTVAGIASGLEDKEITAKQAKRKTLALKISVGRLAKTVQKELDYISEVSGTHNKIDTANSESPVKRDVKTLFNTFKELKDIPVVEKPKSLKEAAEKNSDLPFEHNEPEEKLKIHQQLEVLKNYNKYSKNIPITTSRGEPYIMVRLPLWVMSTPFFTKDKIDRAGIPNTQVYPGFVFENQLVVGFDEKVSENSSKFKKSIKELLEILKAQGKTFVAMNETYFKIRGSKLNFIWLLEASKLNKLGTFSINHITFPRYDNDSMNFLKHSPFPTQEYVEKKNSTNFNTIKNQEALRNEFQKTVKDLIDKKTSHQTAIRLLDNDISSINDDIKTLEDKTIPEAEYSLKKIKDKRPYDEQFALIKGYRKQVDQLKVSILVKKEDMKKHRSQMDSIDEEISKQRDAFRKQVKV